MFVGFALVVLWHIQQLSQIKEAFQKIFFVDTTRLNKSVNYVSNVTFNKVSQNFQYSCSQAATEYSLSVVQSLIAITRYHSKSVLLTRINHFQSSLFSTKTKLLYASRSLEKDNFRNFKLGLTQIIEFCTWKRLKQKKNFLSDNDKWQ